MRISNIESKPRQPVLLGKVLAGTSVQVDGIKLQVDFDPDETALIELWQVLED